MTPQTERRAIAFIRTIANRCTSCLHRTPEQCRGCVSAWANSIMADHEREASHGKPLFDYSLTARKIRILDILQTAGRPLTAPEINLSNLCSRGLKQWTLRRMIRSGQIVRTLNDDPGDGRNIYLYSIPNSKRNNRKPKERTNAKQRSNADQCSAQTI